MLASWSSQWHEDSPHANAHYDGKIMMQPIAYLTCEIKGRDLESRALIAAHLVKRGYTALVGQYWNLKDNSPEAPKGCYLFKTSNKIQAEGMAACKYGGHAIVASDEEALSSSEELAHTTTDAFALDVCDKFLALNAGHKRALAKAYPNGASKILVAGTARADLLRAIEYDRPHPKPYVLFNTSFGRLNSVWGNPEKAIQAYVDGMKFDLNNPFHVAIVQSRINYEKESLTQTRSLLDTLVARCDCDIVIRPHPSENAGWWMKHYAKFDHVRIVTASDPFPWMQHAVLMVHNDSTTGVEAAVMGTRCLNLSPDGPWAERLVLRQVNYSAPTAAAAMDAVDNALSKGIGPIVDTAFNDPFPLDCASTFAQAIASMLPPPRPMESFAWRDTTRTDVQRSKFSASLDDISQAMARVSRIAGCNGYEIEEITDSVAMIRPAG